ncbi:HNH endonuclease [filamentous cyanobacterium CCP5]|nr:HNH endonuclease [filamentous cyanobacterium CCP5]
MPPESERVPASLRREVAQRAQQLCEYCRCPEAFSPDSFTLDHIHPRQLGGATILENLAWACFGCNGRKFTRTVYPDPLTGETVPLFNPRGQSWNEHFVWSENATQAIGQTPYGRTTVEALALNRTGVVNLRRLLASAGLHPPQ